MFVHKTRLEHLLTPAHYFSPQQHQLELERLFWPSWHVLATRADLPNDGDFITLELFGRPLLLRNFEGDIRAFVNVCAHRHCLLSHVPRGNDPRFRCQYHGWEYGKDGRPVRIPDARCFRPWDRENAQLKTLRTETCGELVFVCLDDAAPGLAEYLGPYHSYCAENFTPSFRQCRIWDQCYDSNWKVVVENWLESYHVPCLHQKTYRTWVAEEKCEHELSERFSCLKAQEDAPQVRFLSWYTRRLGMAPALHYTHLHLHPNTTIVVLDGIRAVECAWPTSPTTCWHKMWLFTLRGHKPDWLGLLGGLIAPAVSWFIGKVLSEDAPIYADVQRGLQASAFRGVIGAREERVYAFQQYVLARCGVAGLAGVAAE
jgi:choline monooxygenase